MTCQIIREDVGLYSDKHEAEHHTKPRLQENTSAHSGEPSPAKKMDLLDEVLMTEAKS